MRVSTVVIGAPDPRLLAAFYQRLLGWQVEAEASARPGFPVEDGWVMLRPPSDREGLRGLAIQWEPDYQPPVWPPRPGEPQMMMHVDVAVEDLDGAVAWAVKAGAKLAEHQPQQHVRVMIDPAGHPFDLFAGPVE